MFDVTRPLLPGFVTANVRRLRITGEVLFVTPPSRLEELECHRFGRDRQAFFSILAASGATLRKLTLKSAIDCSWSRYALRRFSRVKTLCVMPADDAQPYPYIFDLVWAAAANGTLEELFMVSGDNRVELLTSPQAGKLRASLKSLRVHRCEDAAPDTASFLSAAEPVVSSRAPAHSLQMLDIAGLKPAETKKWAESTPVLKQLRQGVRELWVDEDQLSEVSTCAWPSLSRLVLYARSSDPDYRPSALQRLLAFCPNVRVSVRLAPPSVLPRILHASDFGSGGFVITQPGTYIVSDDVGSEWTEEIGGIAGPFGYRGRRRQQGEERDGTNARSNNNGDRRGQRARRSGSRRRPSPRNRRSGGR